MKWEWTGRGYRYVTRPLATAAVEVFGSGESWFVEYQDLTGAALEPTHILAKLPQDQFTPDEARAMALALLQRKLHGNVQ